MTAEMVFEQPPFFDEEVARFPVLVLGRFSSYLARYITLRRLMRHPLDGYEKNYGRETKREMG